MSDKPDESQKTEDPTARRLEQARDKGQVANSKEVATWLMLAAGAMGLLAIFPIMGKSLTLTLTPFIAAPHDIKLEQGTVQTVFSKVAIGTGLAMVFYAVLMIVTALASQLLQNGIIFSADPIKPKLEKISPLKGLKRMFSLKSLVEFGKGIGKLIIVAVIMVLLMMPLKDELPALIDLTPLAALGIAHQYAVLLFGGTLSVLLVIAGLDLLYQKMNFKKEQRMTRQELKDEYKQTEGSPEIKQKIRQLRAQRANQRMMADVAESSMVITNPTHYAVALKYEPGQVTAPKVLGKGIDNIALKIREVANENDIPIVENPPLARALFAGAEIDEEIPFEHFEAVAKVVSYLLKFKKLKRKQ